MVKKLRNALLIIDAFALADYKIWPRVSLGRSG
jgi:hypothetical protein